MGWKALKDQIPETIAYTLLSVAAFFAIRYMAYAMPIQYSQLLAEDNWFEYGTAVAAGLAGLIFLILSYRSGTRWQRAVWIGLGIILIFVAGEEISWGQRIFKWSTPEVLREINYQGEITLHNIDAFYEINKRLGKGVAYLTVIWMGLSVLITLGAPKLNAWTERLGIPLIPVRLIPVFLLIPYFFLHIPIPARRSELGEFFTAIAALTLATDLLLHRGLRKGKSIVGLPAAGWMTVILCGVAVSTVLLVGKSSKWQEAWSLETMAVQGYNSVGMHRQAAKIFEYMYNQPKYLSEDAPIHYAKVLVALEEKEKALRILSEAAVSLEAKEPPEDERIDHLRRLLRIYTMSDDPIRADTIFKQVMELNQQQYESSSDPDEKARLLWSMAQSKEARGHIRPAIEMVEQAKEMAKSNHLKEELRRWKNSLYPSLEASSEKEEN